MKNIRRNAMVALAALVAGPGLAACGSSGHGTAARTGALDRGDRSFLAFTACMRRHGVHMSDPYHRSGSSGLTLDLPEKVPSTIRAYNSCDHIIASVMAMKQAAMESRQSTLSYQQRSAQHLGLVRYAECMRAHGIPMLDPDANGSLDLGNVPGIASVGRYTPLFRRADHSCRGLLPAGVADNGTGP